VSSGQNERRGLAACLSRGTAVGTLTLAVLIGIAGPVIAVPPPPPNPSDSDLNNSRGEANARAGEVGKLTNQLAEAEQRLSQLQDNVELKLEQANKAMVDMQTAEDEAGEAERAAQSARVESDAAAGAIERARVDLDKFVAGSYQQGSTIGSISAYMGAPNPADLLARAQLLNSVSGGQLNALEGMERAQTAKSNKDSLARKSLEIAQQKKDEAERAKHNADAAKSSAQQAQDAQESQNGLLEANKSSVEQKLYEAQSKVSGLQGQRQRYQDWLAQKQREEEAAARQAALNAAKPAKGGGGPSSGPPPSAPAGASIEAVIARALSKLGVPYAWGGGNGSGATRGIRDGGVADRFGDYKKIGFDCSGLMIYAFAGVKGLPHYSGYQYTAGRRVPLSQMRRGDMLFWGGYGGIHHVALYLGSGQMVEAPQSGSYVKVSPVRYGGIMPYATRLIG
jgi:cell wall-associated NlpC family hydrolase